MKKMKKIMCLMLAVVLVLGMSMTVFAATAAIPSEDGKTYDIKVPDTDDHTYAVYQIFAGDWSDGDVLSNVVWGASALLPEGVEAGDKVASTILDALVAAKANGGDPAVLAYLDQYVNFDSTKGTVSEAVGTVSKDSSLSVPGGYYLIKDNAKIEGDDAATLYVVQVVGATTITRKSGVPEVDKEVQENSDKTWGDTADYNIGEAVSFRLTGTLPENYDVYETYKYVFHDTLSEGLTFNNDVVVTVNTEDGQVITESFKTTSATKEDGSTEITISCDDLKKIEGITLTKESKIVVKYTATLNAKAVIGTPGNPNEVYLEFSNNPNKDHGGETGTTPEDKVVVFTFEIDGNKVDGKDGHKLEGAEFQLYRKTVVDGVEKVEYVQVTNEKVSGWTTDAEDASTVLTTGTDGLFKFSGLDAGTYFLKEKKAPVGYNLLDEDLEITITSDENGKLTATTGSVTNGTVELDVENNKGSTLPETGGIGTTIFYVLGGILVLCCGVVLIAKKRVSKEF
ncbi:MAG: SpaH/EbpB family LPXTG-anchored major pilin [Lachnospiraceae bacterium]|nr:SpaH/EbpB family LPXTG-anchored major pilin [Lachnospiraceae bacterium]